MVAACSQAGVDYTSSPASANGALSIRRHDGGEHFLNRKVLHVLVPEMAIDSTNHAHAMVVLPEGCNPVKDDIQHYISLCDVYNQGHKEAWVAHHEAVHAEEESHSQKMENMQAVARGVGTNLSASVDRMIVDALSGTIHKPDAAITGRVTTDSSSVTEHRVHPADGLDQFDSGAVHVPLKKNDVWIGAGNTAAAEKRVMDAILADANKI